MTREEYQYWQEALADRDDENETLRAEVERLKSVIKKQANAVRSLHANEETEVNTFRAKSNAAHLAVVTLDSERDANAILTAEVAKLTERLDEAVGLIQAISNVTTRYLDYWIIGRARAFLTKHGSWG